MKIFCPSKTASGKWKDKPQNGRKYLQIIYLIRDLYLEHIKKFLQFNNKKTNKQISKWTKDLNRHFSRKRHKWPKRCEKMLNISHQGYANQDCSEDTQTRPPSHLPPLILSTPLQSWAASPSCYTSSIHFSTSRSFSNLLQHGFCPRYSIKSAFCGVGKMGEDVQKVQTSNYKINKSWGSNVQHGDYKNTPLGLPWWRSG